MDAGRKSVVLRAVIIALGVLLIIVAAYYVGITLETPAAEPKGDLDARFHADLRNKVIDGVKYDYNERLYVLLFIGVDWSEEQEQEMIKLYYPNRTPTAEEIRAARSLWNGGQADFLMLTVINHDDKTITRIPIDRDTMTEINVTTMFGIYAGVRQAQISLSHGYGDGGEKSCENTVTAVEKLLGGISVDAYVAMDMGSISLFNDALGGVTVTVRDDLTALDPALAKGATVTLHGEQAEEFVRARMSVGSGTNEERMARQSEYVNAAIELIRKSVKENSEIAGKLFDTLGPSLVSNMSRARVVNESVKASPYEIKPAREIKGEHTVENGFMAFYADRESIDDIVLDVFYNKLN